MRVLYGEEVEEKAPDVAVLVEISRSRANAEHATLDRRGSGLTHTPPPVVFCELSVKRMLTTVP